MWIRRFRYALVAVLVTNLAVDCALARRLFGRRKCQTKCACICPAPSVPACEAPVASQYDPPIYDECDCSADSVVVTVSEPTCEGCAESLPHEFQPAESSDDGLPAEQQTFAPNEPDEVATPTPDAAFVEPASQDQLAIPPAPLAVPEAAESSAEPLSSAPLSPPPSEPLQSDSAVGDRYSGFDSTQPAAPVESPLPQPLTPAADASPDDIFGEPPASQSTGNASPSPIEPAAEQMAPEPVADAPATTESDSSLDDLFGSPSKRDEEEEEEPTADTSSVPSDTFQAPEPTTPQPASAAPAESQPTDSQPTETQPTETQSTEPAEEAEEEEVYDPFDIGEVETSEQQRMLSTAGGLSSESYRIWTDSSARFQCQARLVRVTKQNVILRRPTGKQLTVPFSRLASSDLEFIRGQVAALRIVRAQEQAAEKLAVAWTD